MIDTPSRDVLAAVTRAAEAIVPPAILGFARSLGDGRVWVLYAYPSCIGEYIVPIADLPDVLRPHTEGCKHADEDAIKATPLRPVEWPLPFARVRRAVSVRIPDFEPATRVWLGLSGPDPLTNDEVVAFESLAHTTADLLRAAEEAAAQRERVIRAAVALLHQQDVEKAHATHGLPDGAPPSEERETIEQALQAARFNKSKTARSLGMSRHQLYTLMRKYRLE